MRRMAEDAGIGHAVISKIVNRTQAPGRRVLEAIASLPRVNPGWVYAGEGEPLLAVQEDVHQSGWAVPISSVLLPGLPAEHRPLLGGLTLPVAFEHFSVSRYAYQVKSSDAIVLAAETRIAPGDFLVLEADRAAWTGSLSVLFGRVCCIRLPGISGSIPALARIEHKPDGGGLLLDTFGVAPKICLKPEDKPVPPSSGLPERRPGQRMRRMFIPQSSGAVTETDARPEPHTRAGELDPGAKAFAAVRGEGHALSRKESRAADTTKPFDITMDEIVAVVVLTLRIY
jgi:hypothetical protein